MLESETLEYQKYKASDFKVNDIVSIKFPKSKFSYGGEDVYNREFARINIPLDQRRGVVASVNEKSDYILIDFPAIRKYGWKFLRTELQKVDTLTKDNLETSAPRSLLDRINTAAIGSYAPCTLTDIKINGINSTTIGSDNTAIGTESHSFEAFPSGYVKTLNEDMPLFQRVEVKPNKIPDYI